MRYLLALTGAALIGCGPDADSFGVSVVLEREPGQMCPSDVCTGIPMRCDVAVQIRLIDDKDDNIAWVSECLHVGLRAEGADLDSTGDLCVLNEIALPPVDIEEGMIRIEVAIWPYSELETPGECPKVGYDLQGKVDAVANPEEPVPAIAGQAYFSVGSSSLAEVELGCLNAELLDAPSCRSTGNVLISAPVLDFDTNLSVSPTVQNLLVSIGEPKFDGSEWTMPAGETVDLERDVVGGMPVWVGPEPDGGVDLEFEAAACVQVFEDNATGVTNTLFCRPASAADLALDIHGVLVRKATQDLVRSALGGSFPAEGLVLGRVLDETGQPAAGITIVPSTVGTTVVYLSDDMATTTVGPSTTSSGAFVSLNAPFDTTWGAMTGKDVEPVVEEPLGGQVTGKVTVIELQLGDPR